jgi:hypothetical protein
LTIVAVEPGQFDSAPPDNVNVIVPFQDVLTLFCAFSTDTTGPFVKTDPELPATGWVVKTRW